MIIFNDKKNENIMQMKNVYLRKVISIFSIFTNLT